MDKLAQLKEYMEAGKYEAAVALLPEIKENKAKTAPEMMLLAGAYGKCADFEHAERLFKKAYKIRPSKLLFRDMIDICIECGRTDEAESYYEHYKEVASSDSLIMALPMLPTPIKPIFIICLLLFLHMFFPWSSSR